MRDVVKDLFAEALLNKVGRYLAGSKSGDPRLPAVTFRHAFDLRVDDIAGNFDGDAFLGLGEIGEFGFHNCSITFRRTSNVERQTSIVG